MNAPEQILNTVSQSKRGWWLSYLNSACWKQTLFCLSYVPNWKDFSKQVEKLIISDSLRALMFINSIWKEFLEENEVLVLLQLNTSLELSEKVVDIIMHYWKNKQEAMNRHYSELSKNDSRNLWILVNEFPQELEILQGILEIAKELKRPIRQRYDMSWRWYGTQLYISRDSLAK